MMSSEPAVELRNVTRSFTTAVGTVVALRDFTMTVERGEFVCIVGPTGCGKSTTLNLITGIAQPTEGEVLVNGQDVTGADRELGFVFQADALFPWKSVVDNVAAGPVFRGTPRSAAREQAREWIARVGLGGFEHHYPHQLSGGMRKRVALAQTFINRPCIILMDEPFSALDVQTRALMQDELLSLWSAGEGASVIFVTHDLEEAITLGDKVYVLSARPATVKSVHQIDLPRPRKPSEMRFAPQFARYARTIWQELKEEVERQPVAIGDR